MKQIKFLIVFSCFVVFTKAQEPVKIHLAKDKTIIYFFKKGLGSDSILNGKNDLFYFLVPDSMKAFITLNSENAQFTITENDSLLRCRFLPGMRYETFFVEDSGKKKTIKANSKKASSEVPYLILTGVNGTSTISKEKILVQIVDRRTNKILIENYFIGVPN